ncbi:YkvS family protein (plasmid) [Bacillus bombysepticus]
MDSTIDITKDNYVRFPYRDNPSIQLTGYVISVLQNTIVVDISETMKFHNIEYARQVVKHGNYHKVS